MKRLCWILPFAIATGLCAAPKANPSGADTNTPSAGKNEAAAIPDATHKPVFTTNTVTIAGQRVTYMAETGMLPILETRRHVARIGFLRGLHAHGRNQQGRAARSRFVSTAGPARRPCGCTSARSARAA